MAWRTLACVLAGLMTVAATPAIAQSSPNQSWPSRPIRWIVPYTPGGLTDAVTRLMAPKLQDALGQPIAIENRPGSNSIIGSEAIANAAPDGTTFGTVIAAYAANATLYAGKLPFDTEKSLVAISLVGIAPLLLTTNLDFPPKDIRQLVAYAKANPGKLSFGSSGIGSAAHLTTELLKQTTGIDMQHVPYKGTAPALQGLIGGEIQILVDVPISLMPQVRGGKIRGQALFAGKRLAASGDVPTIVEAGGPPIEASTWVMFLAPARTPADVVARLSAETARIVATPEMRARFESQGIEPIAGTPAEAAQFLRAEIAKWAKVITTAGVKPE